jgi:hypothetical protein
MWNLIRKIIIVINRATGIVTNSLKKSFEAVPYNTLNKFTTKNSYTKNITHNTESTAV